MEAEERIIHMVLQDLFAPEIHSLPSSTSHYAPQEPALHGHQKAPPSPTAGWVQPVENTPDAGGRADSKAGMLISRWALWVGCLPLLKPTPPGRRCL